jgi:hypothetical protein
MTFYSCCIRMWSQISNSNIVSPKCETNFENVLASFSGALLRPFKEKTGGCKSCDNVPLKITRLQGSYQRRFEIIF